MKVNKPSFNKLIFWGSLSALALVVIAVIFRLMRVVSAGVFVLLLILILLAYGAYASIIYYREVKRRKAIEAKIKREKDERERKLRELYQLLGIEVQYNDDGSIKDLYQLLGISKLTDENGKRILTSYELLGILPRFNMWAIELPNVFAIKNRIKKVARGIAQPFILLYKPMAAKDNKDKPTTQSGNEADKSSEKGGKNESDKSPDAKPKKEAGKSGVKIVKEPAKSSAPSGQGFIKAGKQPKGVKPEKPAGASKLSYTAAGFGRIKVEKKSFKDEGKTTKSQNNAGNKEPEKSSSQPAGRPAPGPQRGASVDKKPKRLVPYHGSDATTKSLFGEMYARKNYVPNNNERAWISDKIENEERVK
mgnify:CR=1 FL=1